MKKRIILFGCQQIAVDYIDILKSRSDVELLLVYTYELPLDVTYGYVSLIDKCNELKIPYKQQKTITSRIVNEVRELNPDFIFKKIRVFVSYKYIFYRIKIIC